MRIVFFFLFFVSSLLQAQNKHVSLRIKADDKISMHNFSYWSELKITSADTSFYYSLHMQKPDKIVDLKPGEYTLRLSSVFNDRVYRKVNLQKKITSVKFTGLQKTYRKAPALLNLSENLKINDTLYIIFSTKGDAITYEKIGITKSVLGYTAIKYQGLTDEVFLIMQFAENVYKYVVALETLGKKENASKAVTSNVEEIYTLELNKEIESFSIAGNWGGLSRLKAVLFAVER